MLQIAPVEIALKLNQTNGENAAGHERHELCQRIRKCERLRAASACLCVCACVRVCVHLHACVRRGYVPARAIASMCHTLWQHNANGDNGRKEACRLSHFCPASVENCFLQITLGRNNSRHVNALLHLLEIK